MGDSYEFRVAGHLSEDLLQSFEPRQATREPGETVFVCPVADDSEFFGVVARCEALGLKLLSLRRVPAVLPQRAD